MVTLGNLYSVPYFLFFGIDISPNKEFQLFKDNTILVYHSKKNSAYRAAKKKSTFGKLVAGTDFEDYAINNKQIGDDNVFIEKKKGTSKFHFAFSYLGDTFGVWFDYSLGKIYVSNDYDKSSPFLFSCSIDDHTPNTMLLAKAKNFAMFKEFIENFKLGNVRYENKKIKYKTMELLKQLIR